MVIKRREKMGKIVENIKASGELFVRRYDENMVLVEEKHVPNLVVSAGLAYMASRVFNNTTTVMSHLAIGTGSTVASAAQTTLVAETARLVFVSSSVSANTVTYATTFAPGVGTGALREAGIFNAATVGTMLCRTIYGVVTKGVLDTVSITWTVTVNPT